MEKKFSIKDKFANKTKTTEQIITLEGANNSRFKKG